MEDKKKRIIKRIVRYLLVIAVVATFAIITRPLSELDYTNRTLLKISEYAPTTQQYEVHNHWPKWTPFYVEKYGLIDTETGVQTEAIFNDKFWFTDEGYAWDYEGHFVDTHGNVVIECQSLFRDYYNGDNPRKYALDAFRDGYYLPYIRYNETTFLRNYHETHGAYWLDDFLEYTPDNGLILYAVIEDNDLLFGYMNTDGEEVVPPIFDRAYTFDDNGYAIVVYYNERGCCGLIDSTGAFILDPEYDIIEDVDVDGETCYRWEKDSEMGMLNSKLEPMN